MEDAAIDEFTARQSPSVQPIVISLRALVRSTLPDLTERLDAGHQVVEYGVGDKMSDFQVYISAHKAHANLGFARGAELSDTSGLVEGTGKNLRHVKIRTPAEVDNPALRHLLEAHATLWA